LRKSDTRSLEVVEKRRYGKVLSSQRRTVAT
jgi:hypothetical protein